MTVSAQPLTFRNGITMKNRFMLAPMTNTQSHEDGTLSAEELEWLSMRAKGQFGMVMTCASHIQANGKGFPGQLGIFNDRHLEGLTKLSRAIQFHGSLAIIQLYHGGIRAAAEWIEGDPVGPSKLEGKLVRALSLVEVMKLRDDFITAAVRAKKAGFNGIEVHGAHGYIIAQFLSSKYNQRSDEYGGSLKNRSRLLHEIVSGIRTACGDDFLIGVRLSPERFGQKLEEIKEISQQLIDSGLIDFLDISLWDYQKFPEEVEFQKKSLLQHFTELKYRKVKLTVAGKIRTGKDVRNVLNSKVDFVSIGRAGILHHNFAQLVMKNPDFEPISLPVMKDYLKKEGVSKPFIHYLKRWEGFVMEDES